MNLPFIKLTNTRHRLITCISAGFILLAVAGLIVVMAVSL